MQRLTTLLVLVLALVLTPAVALADGMSEEVSPERVLEILEASDPQAELAELGPAAQAQAAELIEDNLVATTETTRFATLDPAEAKALGLKHPGSARTGQPTAALAASGCWSHYYYTGWTFLTAAVAYTWMQLNWCSRSGSITSYNISNVGGNGTGLSYEGNTRSTRNMGWEVRGLTTHRWSFWIGGISKCMQIRGGASGLYSRSISCNMG